MTESTYANVLGPLIVLGIAAAVGILWRISFQLQRLTFTVNDHGTRLAALEGKKPAAHAFATLRTLALVALLAVLAVILAGCATGRTLAGEEIIGITTGTVNNTAATVLGLPPFQAISAALGFLGIGAGLHYRGTRVGWDEREEDEARRPRRRPADVLTAPSGTLAVPSATIGSNSP